jgi:hypothetical protein
MRDGMIAHLDADIVAAHLLRDGGRCAGAKEGVEDEVAVAGRGFKNELNQTFWFRECKLIL